MIRKVRQSVWPEGGQVKFKVESGDTVQFRNSTGVGG